MNETFTADKNGYYGEFGGAFVPEMLRQNVESLRAVYHQVVESVEFQKEFTGLLRNYAGRPSPLFFANRLSDKYGAKIYLKREDLNHTGSHKINNTMGQIILARNMGKTRIIAETGAGQHGVATATVCALMGLECVVYMGETDMVRQEPNVKKMEMLGAKVVPVGSGNKTLKDAANIFYHYINRKNVRLIGVEAAGEGINTGFTAATIAIGETGIIHGSKTLVMQNEDGQITEPYSISAGLDYPGVGPIHAWLARTGRANYLNVTDKEALTAAYELTRLEGIIPALESAHALAALGKLKVKKTDIIVVNVSGRGDKDIQAYLE